LLSGFNLEELQFFFFFSARMTILFLPLGVQKGRRINGKQVLLLASFIQTQTILQSIFQTNQRKYLDAVYQVG
jgi:hypothetical protein